MKKEKTQFWAYYEMPRFLMLQQVISIRVAAAGGNPGTSNAAVSAPVPTGGPSPVGGPPPNVGLTPIGGPPSQGLLDPSTSRQVNSVPQVAPAPQPSTSAPTGVLQVG